MLLESLLRRTLKIKWHRVQKVIEVTDRIEVHLDCKRRRKLRCGRCGTWARVRDRLKARRWKHVPLWGIPVDLVYRPARVRCPTCGKITGEEIPWSQGKCRLSTGLIWLLGAMGKLLAWEVVARMYHVHWNTVKAAVQQAVT